MKIMGINYFEKENAGCNNGNYIPFIVAFDNGKIYEGETCRCGCGCYGSDRTRDLKIGMSFVDLDDFFESLEV